MKKELENELIALAPELLSKGSDRSKHFFYGFECGDGWFHLLKELILELKGLGIEGLKVLQVKEKFGGLCFYVNGSSPEIDRAIYEAELEASKTCEVCGELGKLRGKGWVKTLCDKCEEKDSK